ncbi:MAG: hypothetical protein QNK33_02590, partial [Bacteroidales bacterium]|nr:hypothetical protein [Bacteroidales bacterium]
MRKTLYLLLILIFSGLSLTTTAQKKDLKIEDYAQWQNLSTYSISDNGSWISWNVRLVDGDDTLYIKGLDKGKEYKYALSSSQQFTADSKWMAMRINLSEKKQEKMRESKKEIKNKVRLLNLESGTLRVFEDIRSFSFTKDSKHLIMVGYSEKGKKTSDLFLYNLHDGSMKNLGNIKEHAFNKKGTLLAYITGMPGKNGNGVELFNLDNYKLTIINSDTTSFSDLKWEKEGEAFSFLKEYSDTSFVELNHKVFAVTNVYGNPQVKEFNPANCTIIPDGMRVRETYTPVFSEDMSILYFGVYEWTVKESKKDKKDKKEEKEKLPGVDIWHWKDDPIQPNQQVTYPRSEANFTYMFAWNLSTDKVVRISDEELENPRLTGDGKKVFVRNDKAYKPQFRMAHYDYYLIDAVSGKKTEIIKNFTRLYGSSPDGKFLYYFKDKAWWVYDISLDNHVNLTADLDIDFWNTRDDHPVDVKPPWGVGGWFKGDKSFIVYDEYDAWMLYTDGSPAKKLSNGKEKEIRYRAVRLSYEEDFLNPDEDLFFTATGDKTKWSGYSVLSPKGKMKELIYKDMSIGGIRKAKEADKVLFTKQTYADSPDIFATNTGFKKPSQVSATNLQQKDYYWGHSELVEYTNKDGKKLQGALYYPANY